MISKGSSGNEINTTKFIALHERMMFLPRPDLFILAKIKLLKGAVTYGWQRKYFLINH